MTRKILKDTVGSNCVSSICAFIVHGRSAFFVNVLISCALKKHPAKTPDPLPLSCLLNMIVWTSTGTQILSLLLSIPISSLLLEGTFGLYTLSHVRDTAIANRASEKVRFTVGNVKAEDQNKGFAVTARRRRLPGKTAGDESVRIFECQ
jgi:hypothetical protein